MSTGEAVTRPEMAAALAGLKVELVDRIGEAERWLAALLWNLFGGLAAPVGPTVAGLRFL